MKTVEVNLNDLIILWVDAEKLNMIRNVISSKRFDYAKVEIIAAILEMGDEHASETFNS